MLSIIRHCLLLLITGLLASLVLATPAPLEPGPIRADEVTGEYHILWNDALLRLWINPMKQGTEGGSCVILYNNLLYQGSWKLVLCPVKGTPSNKLYISERLWPEPGQPLENLYYWTMPLERDHKGKVRRHGYVYRTASANPEKTTTD